MRQEPDTIAKRIQDYATSLFATTQQLDAVLSAYFARIHPWFPFISRYRFDERLSSLTNTSEHSFVLLLCTIHLILFVPPQTELGSMRSAHYLEIRRLLGLAESQGPLILDLVQCRILLTLYEMNHGAIEEAYLSLGGCARAGIVLGLDHLDQSEHEIEHGGWIRSEERRRTWWAITILDR